MRFASHEVVEHLAEVGVNGYSPGTNHLIFLLGALFEDVEAVAALLHDIGVDFGGGFVEKGVFACAERVQRLVHDSNLGERTQKSRNQGQSGGQGWSSAALLLLVPEFLKTLFRKSTSEWSVWPAALDHAESAFKRNWNASREHRAAVQRC